MVAHIGSPGTRADRVSVPQVRQLGEAGCQHPDKLDRPYTCSQTVLPDTKLTPITIVSNKRHE
jgi:hypothetical protein